MGLPKSFRDAYLEQRARQYLSPQQAVLSDIRATVLQASAERDLDNDFAYAIIGARGDFRRRSIIPSAEQQIRLATTVLSSLGYSDLELQRKENTFFYVVR